MVQVGWLPQRTDPVTALQDVLNFFGVALPEALSQVGKEKCFAFPMTKSNSGPRSLKSGSRQRDSRCFCAAHGPLVRGLGVALVFVPEIPGARAWGVTHWLSPTRLSCNLACEGKRTITYGSHSFTKLRTSSCIPNARSSSSSMAARTIGKKRQIALRLISCIPPTAWQLVAQAKPRSVAQVQALAKRLGLAPGILVGRLQREKLLPWTHLNALKIKLEFQTAS